MNRVVIVAAKRTAIGSFGGSFKDVSAAELGSQVLKNIFQNIKLDGEQIDEVIIGNVIGAGMGQNISRQIAINSGIPVAVPAWTVNMVCGSGMKAVALAARSIRNGEASIVVAGGVENMSQVPYYLPEQRWGAKLGDKKVIDGLLIDGLTDVFNRYHMGITAENLAYKYNLTRDEMDKFAVESQKRAVNAIDGGKFIDEIVPVKKFDRKKKEIMIDTDEFPRKDASMEVMSKLKPAFKKDGTVTAGNSSGINDGAAILVMMNERKAEQLGICPIACFLDSVTVGVDPSVMGIAPVNAVTKLLKKQNLTLDSIDLIEFNEAFAAQSLAVLKGLKAENIGEVNSKKINVNGGAIALGHPIGASGARIIVTLIHQMLKKNAKKGLASLCIGGGMGIASIIEANKS